MKGSSQESDSLESGGCVPGYYDAGGGIKGVTLEARCAFVEASYRDALGVGRPVWGSAEDCAERGDGSGDRSAKKARGKG